MMMMVTFNKDRVTVSKNNDLTLEGECSRIEMTTTTTIDCHRRRRVLGLIDFGLLVVSAAVTTFARVDPSLSVGSADQMPAIGCS